MTKRDIVLRIANETGLKQKDVSDIVQLILDNITNELSSGRDVELRNFGIFRITLRKGRLGRNPKRPAETVQVPPHYAVRFKPGKLLKDRVRRLQVGDSSSVQ